LERLVESDLDHAYGSGTIFTVVDGRIHSLVWDCDQFSAEG
jgi:hypothetical protein